MPNEKLDGKLQETSPEISEGSNQTPFEAITSQEQLNRIISERIGRERKKFSDYEELKAKAARLDELEEAQKTELEKANEKAALAESKLKEATLQLLWSEIALKHGVPANLLQGANRDDLESSALALLEFKGQGETKKFIGGHNPLLGLPPQSDSKADERATATALLSADI